ncbi:PHB accumulation regulatory domain-containing protein, partial [Planococcus sp. SIMBA_160]
DITRSVLTQIIVEEEAKGEHLLPIGFLRQLISLYGSNMELLVPNYLEYSMKAFARNQEKMRETLESTMSGMFPGMAAWEEMGKQNMAMFENAL